MEWDHDCPDFVGAPLVLTLDAGGTNFVFNAIQDFKLVLERGIVLPAEADDLDKSLANLRRGFREVRARLGGRGQVIAASFAFPGPADYEEGVIGDLENLPGYKGAVPLGPILQRELDLPVFIANDGDLFAYGVALHGELKELNDELGRRGSSGDLASVVGMTLGTGWGCGFVSKGDLFIGSSSTGLEIGVCPYHDGRAIEETVSIGGIVRLFRDELGAQGRAFPFREDARDLPEQIAALAGQGGETPETSCARRAFARFGEAFAVGTCWAVDLLDPDLVVVGGGLAGAWDLFAPAAFDYLRGTYESGRTRVYKRVFDLAKPEQVEAFLRPEITVMAGKKLGLMRTQLDTAEAIMLGAYHRALRLAGEGEGEA